MAELNEKELESVSGGTISAGSPVDARNEACSNFACKECSQGKAAHTTDGVLVGGVYKFFNSNKKNCFNLSITYVPCGQCKFFSNGVCTK